MLAFPVSNSGTQEIAKSQRYKEGGRRKAASTEERNAVGALLGSGLFIAECFDGIEFGGLHGGYPAADYAYDD